MKDRVCVHRRIQDFVGGAKAPLAPPPASAPDYCAAVNCLGGDFFWGEGGGCIRSSIGCIGSYWVPVHFSQFHCTSVHFSTLQNRTVGQWSLRLLRFPVPVKLIFHYHHFHRLVKP